MLFSTQVEVVVEVGVELGKITIFDKPWIKSSYGVINYLLVRVSSNLWTLQTSNKKRNFIFPWGFNQDFFFFS